MMTRRTVLVVACVLLALAVTACDEAPTPPSLDGVVGCWTTGSIVAAGVCGAPAPLLIRVEKHGATYYLGIDGKAAEPATIRDGRIVLPWGHQGAHSAQFGLSDGEPALFAWVGDEPDEPTSFFYAPFPAKRLTQTVYEGKAAVKAAVKADGNVYWGLIALQLTLEAWMERPAAELPPPDELTPDSAFGRFLESTLPWPTNPFTGEPMRSGEEPGDFTYTPQGADFALSACLHDGTSITPADGPPPL